MIDWQKEIDRLDAIGHGRALTDVESLLLERAIAHADKQRIPTGLNRALARFGIGRDMKGPHSWTEGAA